MKARLLFAALLVLLVAVTASAQRLESVLTSGGALYTLKSLDDKALMLIKREGNKREPIVIKATVDAELDYDGRLLYDGSTETLFVVWRRASEGGDEIRFVSMNRNGVWSSSHVLATATGDDRTGLRAAVTRMKDEGSTVAFVHAVWWDQRGGEVNPRYALAAFDREGTHLSSYEGNLLDLAGTHDNSGGSAPEDALPLLAVTSATDAVDVVFGTLNAPTATRVKLTPKRKTPDARLYVPIGRSGGNMPHPKFASASNGNAQVMIVGSRVVVYSADETFRFSLYDRGEWSPVRMIPLDETMTAREVEAELRRAISEDLVEEEAVDR